LPISLKRWRTSSRSPPGVTTYSAASSPRGPTPAYQTAQRIEPLGARVVINTIYDPSDGDNEVGRRELGLSRLATIELRRRLNAVNRGIEKLANEHGFLLADLERLFHGHGVASGKPWFVQVIEPNLAGATATAEYWYELLNVAMELPGGGTAT
jgi:hypothetical protein